MAVDKRNVVILAIVLEVEGRENITLDVSTPDSRKKLFENPVKIKEGTTYNMKIVFRVRFDVITGLKYLEEKKRQGTLIEKSDTFMVSTSLIRSFEHHAANQANRVPMLLYWKASRILKFFVSNLYPSIRLSMELRLCY